MATPRKPAPKTQHPEDQDDLPTQSPLGTLRGDFAGEDERLHRSADPQRRSHAAEPDAGHTDEGLASTPQERRRSFRDEWTQEALPRIPPIPGWHLCWLSSTNQWDPIERRMRMGYQPVKPEELPTVEHLTLKSGQWTGLIGINEMVLFKIPMALYQEIMKEFHHEQPLEEERAIREKSLTLSEELMDSEGKSLVELEPDMQQLGRRPRRNPTFT